MTIRIPVPVSSHVRVNERGKLEHVNAYVRVIEIPLPGEKGPDFPYGPARELPEVVPELPPFAPTQEFYRASWDELPDRLYHVAPAEARQAVSEGGLDATGHTHYLAISKHDQEAGGAWSEGFYTGPGSDTYSYRPEGVYTFADAREAVLYANTREQETGQPYDIWQIDTDSLRAAQSDPAHRTDMIRDPELFQSEFEDEEERVLATDDPEEFWNSLREQESYDPDAGASGWHDHRNWVFQRVHPDHLKRVQPYEAKDREEWNDEDVEAYMDDHPEEFVDEDYVEDVGTSPLDYPGRIADRLVLRGVSFEGSHPYFETGTTEVAFIDHTPFRDGTRIEYVAVRPDQRGQGHARALIDDLYERYPGTIDFGDIMEPQIQRLFEERLVSDPDRTRGHALPPAARLKLYRGEGSLDNPSYYPETGAEAGGWWTSSLDSARQYAAGQPGGQVYEIEVDAWEAERRGGPDYFFITDPEVRARRKLHVPSGVTKRDLPITISPTLRSVMADLDAEDHHALIVGGAVRDALLGGDPKDIDVEVYGTDYEHLNEVLSRYGKTNLVGEAFGVLKFTDPEGNEYDFSLPRRDNLVGVGHRGFETEFDPDISFEEAASRRDFTWNALAYDPVSGELHDYFGGEQDLRDKVIRHTSPAFAEDPLRVLRGMQFAARYDMTVAPETAELARSIVDRYGELPSERVSEEFMKLATRAPHPSKGIQFLHDTGWDVHFPALAELWGVPQDEGWHPEGDAAQHTMFAADRAAEIADREGLTGDDRAVVVLASILHDVGKSHATQLPDTPDEFTITTPPRSDRSFITGWHGTFRGRPDAESGRFTMGGFHFGSRRAAEQRIAFLQSEGTPEERTGTPDVFPVRIEGRFFRTSEPLSDFGAEKLALRVASNDDDALMGTMDFSPQQAEISEGLAAYDIQTVGDFKRTFDGIIYRNAGEDRGSLSAVVLDPSKVSYPDGKIHSWGHAEAGGPVARVFMSDIGIKRDIIDRVAPLIEAHMDHVNYQDGGGSPRSIRRLAKRISPGTIQELVWVSEADVSGRPPKPPHVPPGSIRMLELAEASDVVEGAPVNYLFGRDVMPYFDNVGGRHIGEVLREAHDLQMEGELSSREEALTWLEGRMQVNRLVQEVAVPTWVDPGPHPWSDIDETLPTPPGTPEYEAALDALSQAYEVRRNAREAWNLQMARGVALGAVTPEEADERGWRHDGHADTIEPLPETLYHATSALTPVLAGGLKTRAELSSTGLGGGGDDVISFTDDPAKAERIAEVIREAGRVIRGEVTSAELIQRAKDGGFYPMLVDVAAGGSEDNMRFWHADQLYRQHTGTIMSLDEVRATYGEADWRPHPDAPGITGGDGQTRHLVWVRSQTPAEQRKYRFEDLYRTFLAVQERTDMEDPEKMDPLFFSPDLDYLANLDPAEVGVVTVHPRPGARGYHMGGVLGEWRTWSGDAVTVSGAPNAVEVAPRADSYRASWRPTMTPEEARAWAESAGSQYTGTVVHMTGSTSVDGIRGTGFDASEHAVHEAGRYFATDVPSAEFYSYEAVPVAISAVVVLQNPVVVDWSEELEAGERIGVPGTIEEARAVGRMQQSDPKRFPQSGKYGGFRDAVLRQAGLTPEILAERYPEYAGPYGWAIVRNDPELTTKVLRDAGYDGVVINTGARDILDVEAHADIGGSQLIVFDREQATVIGVEPVGVDEPPIQSLRDAFAVGVEEARTESITRARYASVRAAEDDRRERYGFADFTGITEDELPVLEAVLAQIDRLTAEYPFVVDSGLQGPNRTSWRFGGIGTFGPKNPNSGAGRAVHELGEGAWGVVRNSARGPMDHSPEAERQFPAPDHPKSSPGAGGGPHLWLNTTDFARGPGWEDVPGFMLASTAEQAAVHEFGHIVAATAGIGEDRLYRAFELARAEAYKGLKRPERQFMRDVGSIYAGTNTAEAFAEVSFLFNWSGALEGRSQAAIRRLTKLRDLTNEYARQKVL